MPPRRTTNQLAEEVRSILADESSNPTNANRTDPAGLVVTREGDIVDPATRTPQPGDAVIPSGKFHASMTVTP